MLPYNPNYHSAYTSDGTKITKIKQSVDELHILIESARSSLKSNNNNYLSQYRRTIDDEEEKSNSYRIRIDDKDNYAVDVNISFDKNAPQDYWAESRYRTQPGFYDDKNQLDATQYHTARTEGSDFMITPVKQEKSFGELKKSQGKVVSVKRSTFADSRIQKVPETQSKQQQQQQPSSFTISPQVFNYADESMIEEQHKQIKPNQQIYLPQPNASEIRRNESQESIIENIKSSEVKVAKEVKEVKKEEVVKVQQQVQKMLQQPPSMSDIPVQHEHLSPIVVPISKIPQPSPESNYKQRLNRTMKPSTTKQEPRRVKIDLRQKKKQKDSTDLFLIHKSRYLNKLRNEEKSRMDNSRTLSKRKRSLSPSCERITNRLYYTKTNKQPCHKYEHYMAVLQRMRMKETLSDYTFVRRYLSDQQICQIFEQLQRNGVPEYRWPMKVVDVVYSKLRQFKIY